MPVLAIDFGTTTTVAAVRTDADELRLVTIEGSPLLPSAVFLTDGGTLLVGRDAERQARLDPSRFEPNPKRRVDDGEILLGVAAVPIAEVIAAVLRRVREVAGGPFDEVRLSHPARWGESRQSVLLEAARMAGLGEHVRLIAEPVAAATHYASRVERALPIGAGVAVYDLGGGTCDVAVVRRTSSGWDVVAEGGLPDLGGVDFDQTLLDHLGTEHAGPDWAALLAAADPEQRRRLRALRDDVRDAKETLSRFAQVDVPMPDPFPDAPLTREELERLIRPSLARTTELLGDVLSRAGGPVGAVYLVGGSSRIPLVTGLIQTELGINPMTLDQPETTVATGALLIDTPTAAPPEPPPPLGPPPPAEPGPPTRPTPLAPPPAPPSRRWRIPVASAVVLGVVIAVVAVLLTRGGGDPQPVADPPASTTTSPTSSPTPPDRFADALATPAIADYLRPSYDLFNSCVLDPPVSEPQRKNRTRRTSTCRLTNGLSLFLGADTSFGRFFSRIDGDAVGGAKDWREQDWTARGERHGVVRTWLRGDSPDQPMLYWDWNGVFWGLLYIEKGDRVDTSAAAIRKLWQDNFQRQE